MLVAILILFNEESAAKANEKQMNLMITSLVNQEALIVGKDIPFTVHVAQFDEKKPRDTMKSEDKALVYVYFKKDDKVIKRQLGHGQKGDYQGKVKLPESGDWQVVAMTGQKADEAETLKTTWKVNEQSKSHMIIWTVGVIVVILIIGFIIFRKRRSNVNA